jgi:hypothetical protein
MIAPVAANVPLAVDNFVERAVVAAVAEAVEPAEAAVAEAAARVGAAADFAAAARVGATAAVVPNVYPIAVAADSAEAALHVAAGLEAAGRAVRAHVVAPVDERQIAVAVASAARHAAASAAAGSVPAAALEVVGRVAAAAALGVAERVTDVAALGVAGRVAEALAFAVPAAEPVGPCLCPACRHPAVHLLQGSRLNTKRGRRHASVG